MSWAPTAFDGWTTLEAGTYDVTVDMTDFTGNTGTGTLLGVEYDPKDIVVSRVFPMSSPRRLCSTERQRRVLIRSTRVSR
jgi:hypothetical protein